MTDETPAQGFERYVARHAARARVDRAGCGYDAPGSEPSPPWYAGLWRVVVIAGGIVMGAGIVRLVGWWLG